MCRHLAHLGAPTSLQALLLDPPHGLLRQTWAPRRQQHGVVNADGFGIGWWVDDRPVRYRRDVPMWSDASLASLAPTVRSGCVIAAVRTATAGMPHDESACAPFLLEPHGHPPVLLSHNGRVSVEAVAPLVASAALARVGSTVDSAFVAAVVAEGLAEQPTGDSGETLASALRTAVRRLSAADPSARLNLLATDGTQLVATTWGDTLCWRAADGAVVVASEPSDDLPGWTEVPDRSLIVATGDDVRVEGLA